MRCMRIALRVAAAVLVAASAGVSAVETHYRVEMFIAGHRPGSDVSNHLFDLNNQGELVGEDLSRPFRETGFLWSAGKFQSFSINDLEFRPYRINDRRQMAGNTVGNAFILDHGRATNINPVIAISRRKPCAA